VSYILYNQPSLKEPVLVSSWSGIGNIGLVAVDTLRNQLSAEELGEIEPWDFFDPQKARVEEGRLQELEFPKSKFYFNRLPANDVVFFVGEEQPGHMGRMYASGEKAYQMAKLVLDVAEKMGIKKIYTSGACIAATHHQVKPRVVAVASSENLLEETRKIPNIYPMSEISDEGGEGVITGLNGLLLSMAQKRGLDALCLMGEIPDWLSRAPFPFPKASHSVMEAFSKILGVSPDLSLVDKKIKEIDKVIEKLYEKFPNKVKEQYDERKSDIQPPGPITREEAEWMKAHLDDFLKNLPQKQDGDDDGEDQKPT